MKTCDCCKHWDVSHDPDDKEGVCRSPKIKFPPVDGHTVDLDEATVTDGSGYHAQLNPGPKFGCIHHEDK